ncbi:MAG: Rne/Rng family ribonuclease [Clostridiales bacterium]|jgi:ribonuclease G|nr:Rne/Rng family ribonuclease [Clostridiales bacterium]
MGKEIYVDINPFQTRVVLLENGAPSEIYIERRGHERLVGNIYSGKVQNVLPGMQAAFVDIGLERNAFLYAGDILADHSDFQFNDKTQEQGIAPLNIKDIVKPGQEIMVQVLKEPLGTKGARVTTHITLPGRTLVLMPTVNYVGVSRRIVNEEERARLRGMLDAVRPPDVGVIVRTAAIDKTEEEFKSDLDFFLRLWQRILKKKSLVSAPRLLHEEEALVFRTIRDIFTPDIDKLVINDREFFERVQIVANIISPQLKDKVVLYEERGDLFDTHDLDNKIERALSRKVWLNNGGYIIIDQTEALTSIDVNTGRFVGTDNLQETITEANCEAAKEIARQLRLRDISGIIIIDFIDMEDIGDKEKVLETLKEELKKDRTKSNVLGITQLGLVEMTRKKTRQSLDNLLQTACPYCKGAGRVLSEETIVLKVRKALIRCLQNQSAKNYLVELHPAIAAIIEEQSNGVSQLLPVAPGRNIYIRRTPALHVEEFHITPLEKAPEVLDGLWHYQYNTNEG